MFRDSFGRGVKIGPTFTDFFLCKIHIIIWTSHPHVSYIWSPSPRHLWGHPNISDFINLWHASLWEFRDLTMKKVLKRAPFWKFICEVPPPPTQVVGPRGTQMILISSVYGMHRYGNLATTLWKKCWRGAPFWKGNLSWNTRVKGHPAGAPSARVPAGLPTLSP